jgi:hypothetical protein
MASPTPAFSGPGSLGFFGNDHAQYDKNNRYKPGEKDRDKKQGNAEEAGIEIEDGQHGVGKQKAAQQEQPDITSCNWFTFKHGPLLCTDRIAGVFENGFSCSLLLNTINKTGKSI